MGHRTCILIILLVMLFGMAACREDAALPTDTTMVAQIATPSAAVTETKAPPIETAIPTKPDPTATPTQTATAPATPTATAVPTTEPTPTAAPTEVEEIRFQSGHFELVGDLQLPITEGKHPAIIMVHGDGGIDRYDSGKYRPLMARFLRAGYAVFSWDKPGTGESTGEFVDGAWIITDRASILVDAIELLKEHPALDPERIGVWGISQGGIVMPMALTMSNDIAFMIVVSGPGVDSIDQTAYLIGQKLLCEGHSEDEAKLAEQSYAGLCKATTYQEYRENKANLIQFPSALIFTGRDILPEEEWAAWDRDVDAFFDPIAVIEKSTIPVLAFFGEKDTQVDPFQGARAYEQALQRAGNQHSHVELVAGVDHNIVLSETGCLAERDRRSRADWLKYAPEYLDLMEEWLVQLGTFLPPRRGSVDAGLAQIAFTSERDGNLEIYVMAVPHGTDADGSDQRNLTQHPASDDDPHWSPDGSLIAFSSDRSGNYEIYVMDADGTNPQRLTQNPAVDAQPTWSPDGTQIAFVSLRDGNAEIYVIAIPKGTDADGSDLQRLTKNQFGDHEPDWSPDGTQIVFSSSEGDDANICAMNSDGSERHQLTDTDAHDFYPRWSPDGTQIAFLSTRDGSAEEIYVMNSDGSNQRRLTTNDAFDGAPSWSPGGTQFVFASDRDGNHELYVMDADGAAQGSDDVRRLTDNNAADRKPAWQPAVPATANAPALDAISVDTVDQVERLHTLDGHSARIMDLVFSGDGAYLASSSLDKTIKLWDVRSGQEVHTFPKGQNEAVTNSIAFSADGRLLASAEAIWDVESKQVIHTLDRGKCASVTFSPDGSALAVAFVNQPIKLWEVASGQVARTFEGQPDNAAFSIEFSPDGALLAAGGLGGTVRLWNVESGQIAGTLEYGDESGVHDVAFSPDGSVLASGGTDSALRLWDVASGQAVHTLRLPDGLFGVGFSPDGTIVASAGGRGGVRLWVVESGRMLRTLSHDDELMAVAFSPDGTLLASGGYDTKIYLWGLSR
jgi:Tol biopolymer transport system component/acetyl esterase/lipase